MKFNFDKPKDKTVKMHYLNSLTQQSFCHRKSSTWIDIENILGGNNITSNKELVTCKFCLKYKNIWN